MCNVCAFLSLFDLCICICCHLDIVGTTLSPVGDDAAKPHCVDAGRPWRDRYQMKTENAQEKMYGDITVCGFALLPFAI